ncbi:MAG: dihydrofolate reductase family protein [Burkholderiales bacterium]
MRKLIAGMKTSLDGRFGGPEGYADWVDAWSDDYGLMPQIDACLLGGGMYPGYEQYWSAIQNEPDQPLPMTGKSPTPEEVRWAHFAARTPHHVLSTQLTSARWASTRFVRGLEQVAALKQQPGKDIYLIGGGQIASSLIEAGLVDELRLIVYPLLAGAGKALFATNERRLPMELRQVEQLPGGLVRMSYQMR